MKTFLLLFLLCLCLPTLPAGETKPTSVHKPNVISVMIGGAFGQSYEITYDERELRYYAARNFFELKTARPVVIHPSDREWQAFFGELERLKAWKWQRHYLNPTVADGTYWRAVVTYSTREARDVVSTGSNAYPPGFKPFLAAIRKLIGGKKFE